MNPAAPKTSSSLSSLVWVLLIVLVGAVAGVGGYFLGKMDEKDKSSSQAPVQQEPQTGVAEYCTKDWCFDYDRAKWRIDPYTYVGKDKVAESLAGGATLTRQLPEPEAPHSGTIVFSVYVPDRPHTCAHDLHGHDMPMCHYQVESVTSHPESSDLSIVKVVDYVRRHDGSNVNENFTVSMYVADRDEVKRKGLKIGVENDGSSSYEIRFDTGKIFPDSADPVMGLMEYEDKTAFNTLKEAIAELRSTEKANNTYKAYEVLASLHKQTQ